MSTFHQRAGSWSLPSGKAAGVSLLRALFLLVGLFCLFSMGCRDSIPEPTPTEPTPTEPTPTEPMGTSLLLQVVDASGHPIAGAAVSSQNALFSVDSSGHRLFENLPPGRFFARVDALGFASATAVMQLREGAHVGAVVRLLPLSAPIAFEARQGGVIQTEQVRVTLPPDAVVDALGEPVTGTVHVTIAPLDPTHQLAAMPGPLEGLGAADGERVRLESFFMAEVSLWSNGAPVQLAPGKKATLEFLLPEALASQFEPGDTVPAWWFDLDAGHWREEGAGTLQPSATWSGRLAWVVQVNHFTWWNCDMPWTEKSCVNVHVLDEEGTPVKGATVNAEGVSYTGTSEPTLTDGNGRTCIEIKRGGTARIFAGLPGGFTSNAVSVTGTSEPAVCGSGPCLQVQLLLPDGSCTPGAYTPCAYSGPPGTEGQGLCRAGRRQCDVTGTQWSVCMGEVLPVAETCDSPFDEDCDGQVNEGCACSGRQGQPCYGGPSGTQGVGICREGIVGCDVFGRVVCLGQRRPAPEACWTPEDEDCNGVSEACGAGEVGWSATGVMALGRAGGHTATLLPNGKVLVVGGRDSAENYLATAEVYDPATGSWSVTGAMVSPRYRPTATLLPNGKVLVVGGRAVDRYLETAEVYDPATGTWSPTGSLTEGRDHTATLMPNGKVLVVGGTGGSSGWATAEVYDPATGAWRVTGAVVSARSSPTATVLPNGKVLVAGGHRSGSAELYDPVTGTWSPTGSMSEERRDHTATVLPNGKVLVAGGYGSADLATAEVYDPATGTWSATGSLSAYRLVHTATLLPNGKVLVAGGDRPGDTDQVTEVYDPATGTWSAAGDMVSLRRIAMTATLLPNGKVLAVGGLGPAPSLAELYTPAR